MFLNRKHYFDYIDWEYRLVQQVWKPWLIIFHMIYDKNYSNMNEYMGL